MASGRGSIDDSIVGMLQWCFQCYTRTGRAGEGGETIIKHQAVKCRPDKDQDDFDGSSGVGTESNRTVEEHGLVERGTKILCLDGAGQA
ncbi:hypothetical protein HJFPF1_01007 [Paramyrothecium foliicola]|nr:hypothetical protein HJFPF1_01007 [Paramyrothecium foliicola]